ncbi:MAG: GntR family transcriptional regulator [Fibrobacter sp.]|nr:GntR family transcriptional regulator [Fibrobacter sp.]
MVITISDESPVPVYRQIVIQVLLGVIRNEIKQNSSLPTIRQLAADLSLTNTTVSKAYQILERSKIIATAGRRGTFIHENAQENASRYIQEERLGQMMDFISMHLKYGSTIDELEQSFYAAIKKIKERKAK